MTEQIRNERLRTLKAKAEAAGRKFEEGKNRLYKNGKPLFSDEVHAEEMDKLARERNAVLFKVEEEARKMAADASGICERLENADPAELLTDEELTRANGRLAFAREAAEGLAVEDLNKRLQSVLASSDRASIFAHLLAGQRRRQAILERRASLERAEGQRVGPSLGSASTNTTPLDETLKAMEKALGGEKREAELEAAGAIGAEAFEVSSTAHSLRFEGGSPYRPNYAVPGPSAEASRESERLASIR